MSLNRQILHTFLVVALASLVPKAAMIGRDLVIASSFGPGDQVDAFLVALSVPSLVVQILVQAFASGLIPLFMQVREQQGEQAACDLSARASAWGLIGLAVIVAVLWLAAPWIIQGVSPGFSAAKHQMVLEYYRPLLPLVLFQGAAIIWSALLNAHGRFAATSFVPAITPLAVLAVLTSGAAYASMDGVVWATVGGAVLEAASMAVLMGRQGIPLARWGHHPRLPDILHQAVPMMLGMLLGNANLMVDQMFASLLGSGGISVLTFGNKVPAFLLSVAALPLGTAILPHFSRYAARQDWPSLRHALILWSGVIFAASVAVCVLGFVLSDPLVRFLFERGKFTGTDTAQVALVQSLYLLQLPGHLVGLLCSKMLTAMRLNKILLYISIIAFLNNVIFDYIFMKLYGLAGIALSTSLVYTASLLIILTVLLRILDRKPNADGDRSQL